MNVQQLRRDLGLLDAVGIGFGAIVGAGIFVVTGVAADAAGPAILVALLIAGIAASCNALSSAELAARYPQSGGTYEYGYQLLGSLPGFVAGWMFLASKITAAGTVALGMAAYLAALAPDVPPRAVAVAAIIIFTSLNYFGIRRSSRANLLIVAISIGCLVAFVALGLSAMQSQNFRPFAPAGWGGTLRAAALIFFAYTGYARIATLAEEVRAPEQTIPRAIIITIAGAILLYMAVALVAVGSVGATRLGQTDAPLYHAASSFRPAAVRTVVAIGAMTAMLGVILSQILGLSRMTLAMARRGDLPRTLARIDQHVPRRAVLLVGVITAVIAATGALATLAAAAAFAILVYYAIANAAALRLPQADRMFSPVIPVVGMIACVTLALSLPSRVIVIGSATLLVGLLLRLVVRATGE